MSLITIAGGVVGAFAMHQIVRGTKLRFLFERPERFWLAPPARPRPRGPLPESA